MRTPDVIIKTKATPEIEVTGVQVVLQPKIIAAGPPGHGGPAGPPGDVVAQTAEQALLNSILFG